MFSSLLRKQKKPTENLTVLIEGREISLIMRRNPKARRMILRRAKKAEGFVITLPPGCRSDQGIAFALKHKEWISEQLRKEPKKQPIGHGTTFPLRGIMHHICHAPEKRGVVWLEETENTPTLCVSGKEAHIERRVKDWLKKQARMDLNNASKVYADKLNVNFKRISLRDQTSRWGSCSSQGNLSYSWRLILAPSDVLNYVAAHEVAHLLEMNHSQAFWDIVENIEPAYRDHTKWLKENGSSLHQYFD